MKYLLDANIFMQAKNLHYGFDFCPAFWDWLIRENQNDKIFSIEKVFDEINAGGDDLASWANQRTQDFFLKPDAQVVSQFPTVSDWVNHQNYEPAAISTFLQIADYYLICHALGHGCIVVTNEVPANSTKRIKIPSVCIGLHIKFMTPYEMLRHENARFVLGSVHEKKL
jgi:hypothetical protein